MPPSKSDPFAFTTKSPQYVGRWPRTTPAWVTSRVGGGLREKNKSVGKGSRIHFGLHMHPSRGQQRGHGRLTDEKQASCISGASQQQVRASAVTWTARARYNPPLGSSFCHAGYGELAAGDRTHLRIMLVDVTGIPRLATSELVGFLTISDWSRLISRGVIGPKSR
ncbi:hypothetical protein GE21DRAFT_1290608 [Neurospora crassa]|nr:hypothetical protein GE21DRAFT_1290608 [Neurospora crassa]